MMTTHTHDLSMFNGGRHTVVSAGDECRMCPLIIRFWAGERSPHLMAGVFSVARSMMVDVDLDAYRFRDSDHKGRQLFLRADGTRGPVEIERGWTPTVKPKK